MTDVVITTERLRRAAKIVTLAVDTTPAMPGTAVAVAMWEIITGIEDAALAIDYARTLAAEAAA